MYPDCCGRLHAGEGTAATALALMRSRYSAFAMGDVAYLLATWHPATRPAKLALDDRQWLRLEVLETVAGGPFDTDGVVEFVAHYRADAERGRQRERSRFVREDGRWLYVAAVGG